MSKVELYAAIRRDARTGMSNRALQTKHGVGFRTVQKALASAWPEPRKKLPQRTSKIDPYKNVIDQMLRADLDAPRKQRHTTKRIFDRLVSEHHAVGVSYQMVRAYVAQRRSEIWTESGRGPSKAFVPQSHRPGAEAEVDFGEVTIRLADREPAGVGPLPGGPHPQAWRPAGSHRLGAGARRGQVHPRPR
ncbi:transposase [Nonomuraea endophytica]|uniref:Transposase n=1 Tax=Nonomuraea endophytica TaxID=714136 RepID=A0A7W7ZY24_9ACTN|nr:transposase [Nonomuraea endophytica]